jgi:predicted Zn-dependent peptidase
VRDVVYSITPEQVREYHNQHYVGRNIVVSGAGNLDGKALTTEVGTHFGSAPAFRVSEVPNSDKPYFTPSLIYQRDD